MRLIRVAVRSGSAISPTRSARRSSSEISWA